MRRALVIFGLVSLSLMQGTEALAWGNGEHGPNTFGTHDLILREALTISHGRGDWVCTKVAMAATDDPDTAEGIAYASGSWWHVWDEWGATYGEAPEAVRRWYQRVINQLRNGHRCGASRALGIMSHMISSVAQPMHTDDRLAIEDQVRSAYEHEVDKRCSSSQCQFVVINDGFDRVRPYPATLAVARAAHPLYGELVRTFDRDGYTNRVHAISRRQINRAANVLADLIRSLPR